VLFITDGRVVDEMVDPTAERIRGFVWTRTRAMAQKGVRS